MDHKNRIHNLGRPAYPSPSKNNKHQGQDTLVQVIFQAIDTVTSTATPVEVKVSKSSKAGLSPRICHTVSGTKQSCDKVEALLFIFTYLVSSYILCYIFDI